MRNQLLRDSDWASMAHSLELRVPLVDVDLLRTVARLIPSGHPPGKAMMASATRRPLPEPVISRRKTGFGIPVKEWTQSDSLTPFRGLRGWATYVYSCFCKGRLDKSSHMG